jgi:hypothetical protein
VLAAAGTYHAFHHVKIKSTFWFYELITGRVVSLLQELGLDEIRQAATMRPTPKPIRTDDSTTSSSSSTLADDTPSSSMAASSSSSNLQPITEEVAKQLDPEIELKRAMSEQAAWGGQMPDATAAAAAAAPARQQQPAAAAAAPAGQVRIVGFNGALLIV